MTELIPDSKILYSQTLQFATSSIVDELFAESLDHIIRLNEDNVPSFLSRHFSYRSDNWSCKECFIHDVNPIIRNYYDTHNKAYPNSFKELNLDIPYLYKIQKNLLIGEKYDHIKKFYKEIKDISNSCFHSTYVSNTEFTELSDKLRDMINKFTHLNNQEKESYISKLNYILENLLFVDATSLLNELDERMLLLRSKDQEKINIINKINNLENEKNYLITELNYLNSLIAAKEQNQ